MSRLARARRGGGATRVVDAERRPGHADAGRAANQGGAGLRHRALERADPRRPCPCMGRTAARERVHRRRGQGRDLPSGCGWCVSTDRVRHAGASWRGGRDVMASFGPRLLTIGEMPVVPPGRARRDPLRAISSLRPIECHTRLNSPRASRPPMRGRTRCRRTAYRSLRYRRSYGVTT